MQKYVEGRYKGGTPLRWTYLLLGRDLCPMLVVGEKGGSGRGTPVGNIKKKIVSFCPLVVGREAQVGL